MGSAEHQLSQFFGAYFHQDWVEDSSTWENVAEHYAKNSDKSSIKLIAQELEKLSKVDIADAELFESVHEMGCFYFAGSATNFRLWLKELANHMHKLANRMQVKINANMVDQETSHISDILYKPFKDLEQLLLNDYGGTIEHLWIDFELIDRARPPFSFRFQKRVSGRGNLTGIDFPDEFNVGHYSVKPDFAILLKLPDDEIVKYALNLIYQSTSILIDKTKKLGGFNAELFRTQFLTSCDLLGYQLHAC